MGPGPCPTPPPSPCSHHGKPCTYERGTASDDGSWDHAYYTGSAVGCCGHRRSWTTWCEYDTVFIPSKDPSKVPSICASWKKGTLKKWIPDVNGPHTRLLGGGVVEVSQTLGVIV